jgi:hypothetical protein
MRRQTTYNSINRGVGLDSIEEQRAYCCKKHYKSTDASTEAGHSLIFRPRLRSGR